MTLTCAATGFALFLTLAGYAADDPGGANRSIHEPHVVLHTEGVKYAYPRWSPDGRQVLFQSDESGHWQLFVSALDGSGRRLLSRPEDNCYFGDWSPDGSLVAFVSDRSGNEEVYVMNSDGTGLRNLTNDPARDIHPYWTPDGSRILFNSTRSDPADWSLDVFSMLPDGSGVTQITATPDVETCARMSPDGSRIVLLRMSLRSETDDILVMSTAGAEERLLTHDSARDGWPVWSASGDTVIYSSQVSGQFCLMAIPIDGGAAQVLTHPPTGADDGRAQISPDGATVLFNRDLNDSTIAVYRLALTGRDG